MNLLQLEERANKAGYDVIATWLCMPSSYDMSWHLPRLRGESQLQFKARRVDDAKDIWFILRKSNIVVERFKSMPVLNF